jgi:hypothetical protein
VAALRPAATGDGLAAGAFAELLDVGEEPVAVAALAEVGNEGAPPAVVDDGEDLLAGDVPGPFGTGALAAGRAGDGRPTGTGPVNVAVRDGNPADGSGFAGPMATSASVGRRAGTAGLAADGAGGFGPREAAAGEGDVAEGDGDAGDGETAADDGEPAEELTAPGGSAGGNADKITGAVGAFGTPGASEPQPSSGGGSVLGAGGISLIGMTKPHLRHFIRTERPVTFSSAI